MTTTPPQVAINDKLILVGGKSATGKSASLMGLRNPEGVMYLNCESGKKLPFKANFMKGPDGRPGFVITDPLQVFEAFDVAETLPNVHTIVVDTQTYLMEMYESLYVINSSNTMAAWGNYAQYHKTLMQQYVAKSTKNVVMLAHTADSLNEGEMIIETKVPVKGSLKNNGIESYFSIVIASKKVPLKALANYKSDMLTITPEEEALGFKYVFQCKLTKESVNERLRGPLGLFSTQETYIDNNMQLVLDRLHSYYD